MQAGGVSKRENQSLATRTGMLSRAFLARPIPVRPNWQNFKIDGKDLFSKCNDYLKHAGILIQDARLISDQVHGKKWPHVSTAIAPITNEACSLPALFSKWTAGEQSDFLIGECVKPTSRPV